MTIQAVVSREADPVVELQQRRARSLLRNFHPFVADIKPTWTVSAVRGAVTEHERGKFEQSSKLVEAMGRDDRLPGVLNTRVHALLGSTMLQEPAQVDDAREELADEVAEFVGRHWLQMFPEAQVEELLNWRRMMGFALGQLVWKRTPESWLPTLETWHPQYIWFEEERRLWHIQAREGDIIVEPGDGQWILLGPGQRPYMSGLLRGLSDVWMARRFAWRDWNRFNERHGLPIIKAKVPAISRASDQAAFAADLRVLATETTVTLPTNLDDDGAEFDLELLEARDMAWETFGAMLDKTADSFAVSILANNLMAEVRGGSFAAAKVGSDTFGLVLTADEAELSTTLREQAITWVAELNFGDRELAPWPRWQVKPPEDVKEKGDAFKSLGEGVQALQAAGLKLADPEAFAEKFGILIVEAPPPEGPAEPVAPPVSDDPDPDAADDGDEMGEELASIIRIASTGDVARTKRALEVMALKHKFLASGDPLSAAPGLVPGQIYTDDVADATTREAKRALRPDLETVLAIVNTSTDFGDMRARLREAFRGMDPDAFALLLEASITMTELAGRVSAVDDIGDDAPPDVDEP